MSAMKMAFKVSRIDLQTLFTVEKNVFSLSINSSLLEGTYTTEEVAEIILEICQCICGDIESELINTSHMNVLLLKQLFTQAEHLGFALKGNISEMQNGDLLEEFREKGLGDISENSPEKCSTSDDDGRRRAGDDTHPEAEKTMNLELAHENLKKILYKKNEVIKGLRERLKIYEEKE
ncbi:leucine zipper transcription factor-like protein 1 isoform X2 [Ischnura elegans]|uniref:leucine zipper transcription factor-like protein 1 isoform X2 n=2 Tax=Ischnura elegans TaxID=197161 RepID=UPI001ED896D1|nr:leucine zipper transcription factor-like protein 1 isoform X2 [Ischnura elegans]